MSNGNTPQLNGWQYVILEIAKIALPLIAAGIAGMGAKWAYEGKQEASAAKFRAAEAEKRAYDVQVHQRKMIIGSVPPEPIRDE